MLSKGVHGDVRSKKSREIGVGERVTTKKRLGASFRLTPALDVELLEICSLGSSIQGSNYWFSVSYCLSFT